MVKLIDADGYTRRGESGEMLWRPGEPQAPIGVGFRACGPGVIHAYQDALQAVLCDPIHGEYGPRALAYTVVAPDAADAWQTDGLKCWTTEAVTLGDRVTLPEVTDKARVAWAIVVAPHPSTRDWAIGWLSGADRSAKAAEAAAGVAEAGAATAVAEAAAAAWAAVAWTAAGAATAVAATAVAATAAKAAASAEWWRTVALPAFERAQAILAGTYPAERYDEPLEER